MKIRVRTTLLSPIVLIGLVVLISACSAKKPIEQPTISDTEVMEILVKSVKAASIKFPKPYCLDPTLSQRTHTIWPTTAGPDGWVYSPPSEATKYRRISSSQPERLPGAALTAFGDDRVRNDCRHTLVFAVPEITEFVSSRKSGVEAAVFFHDNCPTCGAGFIIHLLKTGQLYT